MQATPCIRCRAPLPGEARFCNHCGSPAPARAVYAADGHGHGHGPAPHTSPGLGFVAPGTGMPVCLGCGVIAPTDRRECAICKLDLPASTARAHVARVTENRYWVAVRCRFQCRVCGHLSPLDHLDMDGSVVCASCGVSQAFDASSWHEGLAHAHAIGDLSGPAPEGQFPDASVTIAGHNEYAAIGVDQTSTELRLSGMIMSDGVVNHRSLMVEAAPGQPLCATCRVPLHTVTVNHGDLTLRCARCADTRRYQAPRAALAACPGLVGVMADEHRTDDAATRQEARIDESAGGAIAIRCPNCSAGVSVTGASTIVDCQYCHISLRIPSRVFHSLGRGVPEPLTWWLLFSGPSPARQELLSGRRAAEHASARAASDDARTNDTRAIEKMPEAGHSAAMRALGLIVPLAIFFAVGAIFFLDRIQAWLP